MAPRLRNQSAAEPLEPRNQTNELQQEAQQEIKDIDEIKMEIDETPRQNLQQQLQIARERNARLRQEEELQRLRAENAAIEDRLAAGRGDHHSNHPPYDSSPRSYRDLTTPPSRETRAAIKLKDPDPYYGKTLQEYNDFRRTCENAFLLAPHTFPSDWNKIAWTMQYLKGDVREACWQRQEDQSLLAYTWKEFLDLLLNMVDDPANRMRDAAAKFNEAKQRSNQTVRSFATYLDTIEAQLRPYGEEHRIQHLFAKLLPEIQITITNNSHDIPDTREGLISLASRMERNLKRVRHPANRMSAASLSEPTSDSSRGTSGSPRGRSRGRGNRRSYDRPASRQREITKPYRDLHGITSYHCHQRGYYSTQCPQKQAPATAANNVPIRTQPNHQAGKESTSP